MEIMHTKKVVLLEGSRTVLIEDRKHLVSFAKSVAEKYTKIIFRSGNADGIDAIEQKRMEQILPYPNNHKKRIHNDSKILLLNELKKEGSSPN